MKLLPKQGRKRTTAATRISTQAKDSSFWDGGFLFENLCLGVEF
jgi:hypothetical protein